jgi:hypothetical protein
MRPDQSVRGHAVESHRLGDDSSERASRSKNNVLHDRPLHHLQKVQTGRRFCLERSQRPTNDGNEGGEKEGMRLLARRDPRKRRRGKADLPHPFLELLVAEDGSLLFFCWTEVGEEEVEEGSDNESFEKEKTGTHQIRIRIDSGAAELGEAYLRSNLVCIKRHSSRQIQNRMKSAVDGLNG